MIVAIVDNQIERHVHRQGIAAPTAVEVTLRDGTVWLCGDDTTRVVRRDSPGPDVSPSAATRGTAPDC